jgi:excisionase family DNA binding protein
VQINRKQKEHHQYMTNQPARTPESPVPPRRALCGEAADRLLTVAEVARCLGVTPRFVYAEVRADRIPHVRLGRYYRFHPDAISAWLTWIERGTVA